mmetsp:Transcript_25531/g.65763  ORF Transcript_25531/g.65763 Transcript_25531/m.65763 type:complete len:386 (-) Transcript_25531:873-2030(-)
MSSGSKPTLALAGLVNLCQVQRAAEQILDKEVADYYAGGAEDEATLQANVSVFRTVRIWPRVLVDVSALDTNCVIPSLRINSRIPIMIAPVAMQKLAHPDGECAAARAAATAGTLYCISQQATTSIEGIAAEGGNGPKLFQLYVLQDREVVERLIRKAEASGCSGLAITVDSPVLGRRERDIINRFKLKQGMQLANFPKPAHTSGSGISAQDGIAKRIGSRDSGLDWEDLRWLKQMPRLPVILKGVLRYNDALLAVEHGADAVWVSNHGGRQLDHVPSTLEALPEVVAGVAGRIPILFDGGVRRGTDVLKAMALGADAVFIGRPVVCGLAVGGEAGVAHVLQLLEGEFRTAMALAGCPSLASIDRSLVQLAGEDPPREVCHRSNL